MYTAIQKPYFVPTNYNIFQIINFRWYEALPRANPSDPDPIYCSNNVRSSSRVAWWTRYKTVFPHSLQYIALRAITLDDVQQLELILKQPNFNINKPIDKKYHLTPLQYAALKNKFPIIQLLLMHGANINQQDIQGNTPLMMAVQNQCLQSINSLLKNGCQRNITNVYGKTASQKAIDLQTNNIANFINNFPYTPRKYPKFKIKLDIQKLLVSPVSDFLNNYKIFNNTILRSPFNNFKGVYRVTLSDTKIVSQLIKQKQILKQKQKLKQNSIKK